jgi:4-hydroxy-tetrahydrodipicolinate reductase
VIRVAVIGARGRMGRQVCGAVAADGDMDLFAAIDRSPEGAIEGVEVTPSLDILKGNAEVAVDFTHSEVVMETARRCLGDGVHLVVGTSGIDQGDLDELRSLAEDGDANAIVVANFAIGAVLMMRFAEEAAKHFDAVEVIELHHDGKVDAPSGTALATAKRVAAARAGTWRAPAGDERHPGARGTDVEGVKVHSVRLPGLLAHQEVLLGGPGQVLSIRHDSTDRMSFIPGVLLAIRAVGSRPGLTVGLEPLLP